MRSVDLTFDEALEAAVRDRWQALLDLGISSLATHRGASNRPHVTLSAGEDLELTRRPAFAPCAVRLGAPLLFLRRSGAVLALTVIPSHELLELHGRVAGDVTGAFEHTLPGAWTPHVTLARRVTGEQTAAALDGLRSLGDLPSGLVTGLRFWNGDTRTVTDLLGL